MKNKNLFIVCAIASMVPWGMILKLLGLGLEFQIIGIIIQLLGLGIMVLKRKQIF